MGFGDELPQDGVVEVQYASCVHADFRYRLFEVEVPPYRTFYDGMLESVEETLEEEDGICFRC